MFQISNINSILPKLIVETRNLTVAQSRFLRRANEARKTQMINPGGLYSNFTSLENDSAYAVDEGGPMLPGAQPEYAQGVSQLRQHWTTISWTGGLERIKSAYLVDFKNSPNAYDPRAQGASTEKLNKYAESLAVKAHMEGSLRRYASRENFFALQGRDKSAIGVVTDVSDTGAGNIRFDWTTPMGNRRFNKNQQIEFRDGDGVRLDTAGGAHFVTVDQMVDKTSGNSTNGAVHFDGIPVGVAAGHTAHFRNSYGKMPVGVKELVSATAAFMGIAVSTNPSIYAATVIELQGGPTIAPLHIRDLEAQMQVKVGYETKMMVEYWWSLAQEFNWQTQIYNSPYTRFISEKKVNAFDMSPGDGEWNGKRFNSDPDMPPADVFALNMAKWEKVEQTPGQPYEFDAGIYIKNPVDSDGNFLDAKMSVYYSEYNWRLNDRRDQGILTGFSFNPAYVGAG